MPRPRALREEFLAASAQHQDTAEVGLPRWGRLRPDWNFRTHLRTRVSTRGTPRSQPPAAPSCVLRPSTALGAGAAGRGWSFWAQTTAGCKQEPDQACQACRASLHLRHGMIRTALPPGTRCRWCVPGRLRLASVQPSTPGAVRVAGRPLPRAHLRPRLGCRSERPSPDRGRRRRRGTAARSSPPWLTTRWQQEAFSHPTSKTRHPTSKRGNTWRRTRFGPACAWRTCGWTRLSLTTFTLRR